MSLSLRRSLLPQRSVEGTLLVDIADDFVTRRSWMVYHLRERWTGRLIRLHLQAGQTVVKSPLGAGLHTLQQRGLTSGDFVTLMGEFARPLSKSSLPSFRVASLQVRPLSPLSQVTRLRLHLPGSPGFFGFRKDAPLLNASAPTKRAVAVLIVRLKDAKAFNEDKNALNDLVFQKNNDVYDKSTFGLVQFTSDADGDNKPDIYGPYTLNDDSSVNCFANYRRWQSEALALAQRDGVDFSPHNHIVFILPNLKSCKFAGIAALGNFKASGPFPVSIRTEGKTPRVTAHELGHNLGLRHASVDPNNDGKHNGTNSKEEYGDHSCLMSVKLANFNAPHMLELRVFDRTPGQVTYLKAGTTQTKLYPLLANPSSVGGPQVLVLPNFKLFRNYVLSFKAGRHYDKGIKADYKRGVSVHTQSFARTGQTLFVKTLKDGETFKDSNNIVIRQIRRDPSNAFVELAITVPGPGSGCKRAPPLLANVTGTFKVGLRQSSELRFRITNQNSGDCGSSLYSLTSALPVGYVLSHNLYAAQQVAVRPGGTVTMTVGLVNDGRSGTVNVSLGEVFPGGQAPVTVSARVEVETSTPTTPNLRAFAVERGKVQLYWDAAVDKVPLLRYQILRQLRGKGAYLSLAATNPGTRGFLDTRIPGDVKVVSYVVRAVNRFNNLSKPSQPVTLRLDSEAPPSAPLALKVSLDRGDAVLAWEPPAEVGFGVKEYRVYHALRGESFQLLGTAEKRTYRHSAITFSTQRYFVTAVTSQQRESSPSPIVSLDNPDAFGPSAPRSLRAAFTKVDSNVRLSWEPSQDRETGVQEYVLYKKGPTDATFSQWKTVAAGASLEATDDAVLYGKTAYYAVAVDGVGNRSKRSNVAEVSREDLRPPSAPSSLRVRLEDRKDAVLDWSPSSDEGLGVKEYVIWRKHAGQVFSSVATVSSTSYRDKDIPIGVVVYKVSAQDKAGNRSGFSELATVKRSPANAATSDAGHSSDDAAPPQGQGCRCSSFTETEGDGLFWGMFLVWFLGLWRARRQG